MVDIVQVASTFAAGAAGALSMVKLLKIVERRQAEPERKRIASLFPNGEKQQMIDAIDLLRQAATDRHKEVLRAQSDIEQVRADVARLAKGLGISL
jgi:hypothetical protein